VTGRVSTFGDFVKKWRRAERNDSALLRLVAPSRRAHAQGAAALAGDLAARWGYDAPDVLRRAALGHDLGRALSLPTLHAISDWYGFEPDDHERAAGVGLLHGPAGGALAAAAGFPAGAAAAVRYHVTGRPSPPLADKIIMAADAAEPSRTYPWAGVVRDALASSLDLAVAFWIYLKTEAVKAGGLEVHPRAVATLASFDEAVVAEARRLGRPFI